MLVSTGAVCLHSAGVDSRFSRPRTAAYSNPANLLPPVQHTCLQRQRNPYKFAYRQEILVQKATTRNATHSGLSSGHLQPSQPRTYDVPVVPQNINVHTSLIKVLLRQATTQMSMCNTVYDTQPKLLLLVYSPDIYCQISSKEAVIACAHRSSKGTLTCSLSINATLNGSSLHAAGL